MCDDCGCGHPHDHSHNHSHDGAHGVSLGHSHDHQDKARTALLDALQHFKSIRYGRDKCKIRLGR